MSPEPDSKLYCFGPYEADPRSGELRKQGVRIPLREQPFQILLLLLERPGEVVLRDEMRIRLWPAHASVDFDHGINTSVRRLRDALEETAADPRHIETVGRRGYRFISHVDVVEKRNNAQHRLGWFHRGHATVLAVLLLGFAAWWISRFHPEPRQSVRPLTALPGLAKNPSFSPDGSKVAFAWTGYKQQDFDIYVTAVSRQELTRLTAGPANDESPAYSPDGRHVAFVRTEPDGRRRVAVVPSSGGPPRIIGEVGPGIRPNDVGLLGWTPDGQWLAVARRRSVQEQRAIWLIGIDSGEQRRLTTPPQDVDDANPSFSPDGRFLSFSRGCVQQYSHRPFVMPLNSQWKPVGEPRELSSAAPQLVTGIAWVNNNLIVYGAGAGATGQLWKVPLSGRAPPERLHFSEDAASPSISPRTGRLVYNWRTAEGHIWRFDTRSGKRETLMSSRGVQMFPKYSPDGTRIAFASTRSGNQEIWVCDADGANCAQLTSIGGPQTGAPDWSPDGRWLAFDTRWNGLAQVYVISSKGGIPRRLDSSSDDFTPSWSRDGRWIYFSSSRGGTSQIWKMPSQGGSAVQLTTGGGLWPHESADGAFVYYVRNEPPDLYRVLAAGSDEEFVLPLENANDWALERDGLYTVERAAPGDLQFFSTPGRRGRRLASLEAGPRVGLCVSPDGRYILGASFRRRGDLMLVENFR